MSQIVVDTTLASAACEILARAVKPASGILRLRVENGR